MQFTMVMARAIADGTMVATFRRWRRPQAIAGRRYRTPAGMIEVTSVDIVEPSDVTDADARDAAHTDRHHLLSELRGDPELPLYRVRFRLRDEPDPRDTLAADAELSSEEVAAVRARLERLDRASPRGPWTAATLEAIAESPGVRAADLAARLGRDRASFKLDVRKLKALGLTHSLDTGYRLSARGVAYRAAR